MGLIERFTPGGNLYAAGSSTFAMLETLFRRIAENRDKKDTDMRAEWKAGDSAQAAAWKAADTATLSSAQSFATTQANTARDAAVSSSVSTAKVYTDEQVALVQAGEVSDGNIDAGINRALSDGRIDTTINDAALSTVIADPTSQSRPVMVDLIEDSLLTYTPEQEGAVGDGVTNDSAALHAAANKAATFGATLLLTAPKYSLGTNAWTLPENIRIRGNSKVEGGTTASAAVHVKSNSTIEGISVRNSGTGYRFGINVRENADNVQILGVTFHEGAGVGVYMNSPGISNVKIDRCRFDGHSYAILSNSGGNETDPVGAHDLRNVTITRNSFVNIQTDAIELNHPFGGSANGIRSTAQNFIVSGNIISQTLGSGRQGGFGVGVAGASNVTITDNIVLAARYEGIHVEDDAKNVVIANNHVVSVSGDDAFAGISILPSVVNVTVTGNTVENIKGVGVAGGINIGYSSATVHTSRVVIANNVITNVDGAGITVSANTGGSFRIFGNDIRDVTGNGVTISGSMRDGFAVHDNTIVNVGGHGMRLYDYSALSRPHIIRDNTIINASLGDYAGTALTAGLSPVVQSRNSFVELGPTSATSTGELPLMRLGAFAQGTVRVSAQVSGSSVNRGVYVFGIRWDGTTLTYNRQYGRVNGTFSSGALKVVDGSLVFTAAVGASGVSMRGTAEFTGHSVEDGLARTGTVNGATITLPGAATDTASTQALANALRTALINAGVAS